MSITPAQIFRSLRAEHHFTTTDVSARTGIPVDRIEKFELGAQEPVLSELCALLVTFQSKFDALFTPLSADITAEVSTRLEEYHPKENQNIALPNRLKNFHRSKANLNKVNEAAL